MRVLLLFSPLHASSGKEITCLFYYYYAMLHIFKSNPIIKVFACNRQNIFIDYDFTDIFLVYVLTFYATGSTN